MTEIKTNEFVFFREKESLFSLDHLYPIKIDNRVYNCAGQYVLSQKALLFLEDDIHTKIIGTKSPRLQKIISRKMKNVEKEIWKGHREDYILKALFEKFSNNKKFKRYLLLTGDRELVYCSKNEKIMGIGLDIKDTDIIDKDKWKGKNLLGNILMDLREKLHDESI